MQVLGVSQPAGLRNVKIGPLLKGVDCVFAWSFETTTWSVSLGRCDGDEDTHGTGVVSIFLYSGSRVNVGLLHFGSSREAMVRIGPVSDAVIKRDASRSFTTSARL